MQRAICRDKEDATLFHYAWDAQDNLKTLTDGRGNVSTFAYDTLGRQIPRANALAELWQFVERWVSGLNLPSAVRNRIGQEPPTALDRRLILYALRQCRIAWIHWRLG